MPNERVLNEKKRIVEELTEKLKYQAGVFVNYSGINVNEDTEMRVKLREANIDYTVVKNTLMKLAIKNVGFEELNPIFNGTTSLAVSNEDLVAPARVIKEYTDKFNGFFDIKGGYMNGKVLSVSEVIKLAGIPPLPILQAQLLGTMLAPITGIAVVLKAIADKKGGGAADAEITADQAADAEPVATVNDAQADAKDESVPEKNETVDTADAAADTPTDESVVEDSQVDSSEEEPLEVAAVSEVPVNEAGEQSVSDDALESTEDSEAPAGE